MSEEIYVVYNTIQGTSIWPAYHGTVVYVNSAGVTQYVDGGPSIPPPDNIFTKAYDTAAGAYDAYTGKPSPNGTLLCASGSATQVEAALGLSTTDFLNEVAPTNSVDVLALSSGSLASQFASMQSACTQINAAKLPYSAATQNSDSVLGTVIEAAGYKTPADTGPLDTLWAPGIGNILKTTYTAPSDLTTNSSTTTGGITTDTITDKNSAGTVEDTQVYSFNPTARYVRVGICDGQQMKCLMVVDEFTHESLDITAAHL